MTTRHLERLEEKNRQLEKCDSQEQVTLQRHLRKLDRATLDEIERKFGQYIPQGRVERLRQEPARFLNHEDYNRHLRDSSVESSETKRVLGDVNGRVYVDREHILVPRTLAHERLHQVSDKLYGGMLGREMDEGTTEHFASKLRGDLHLVNTGRCYPEQRKLVEMLSSRVGDDTIARAYFQGNWTRFQNEVDGQLGDGALAEISGLVKQSKFKDAEEIIKKGV